MKKLFVALSIALACAAGPVLLMAQDNTKLPTRVDRLVDRLRSENKELQKAAEEDLRDLGKDATDLLKSHRDAAEKDGNADLVERIERIIGPKAEAPALPEKVKSPELPPPLPSQRRTPKLPDESEAPASKSYSTLQLSLWRNGKSTTFERDADGRFKVSEREGKGELKVQEFEDEEAFKAGAPELYETFRSVAPNFAAPKTLRKSLPDGDSEKEEAKGLGKFNDIFKQVERMLPEEMRESMKKVRESMEELERGDGNPFERLFKDFGEQPGAPDGDPMRGMQEQLDKLFKDFGFGRNPFDRGDGGELPKDSEDKEEHY